MWWTFGNWNTDQSDLLAYGLAMGGPEGGNSKVRKVFISSTLRDRTPAEPPRELEEAEVIWGGPSSFSWGSTSADRVIDPIITRPGNTGGGSVTFPPEDEEPEVPPALIEVWEEINRVERSVRINGTQGAYIDVMRLDEITWRLPDLPGGQVHIITQRYKKFSDG